MTDSEFGLGKVGCSCAVTPKSSSGRAFHKLLEIFQKVSRNFSKSCSNVAQKNNQKLLFVTKVARKNKNFLWSDAKICKLYNRSKISRTNLKQGAHIYQPTAWPVSQARAQPYHHANEP